MNVEIIEITDTASRKALCEYFIAILEKEEKSEKVEESIKYYKEQLEGLKIRLIKEQEETKAEDIVIGLKPATLNAKTGG